MSVIITKVFSFTKMLIVSIAYLKDLMIISLVVYSVFVFITHEERKVEDLSINVKRVMDKLKLSKEGQSIFLKNEVHLHKEREVVQRICSKNGKHTTLGCYFTNNKIHIYENDLKEFEGITTVTMAHELLHSVYHELSSEEKKNLKSEFHKMKINVTILNKLKLYRKDKFYKELYSILPTEQLALTPYLEKHYKKYFQDRKGIVRSHKLSKVTEEKLKQKISLLSNKIKMGKVHLSKIEKNQNILKKKIDTLKSNVSSAITLESVNVKVNKLIKDYNKNILEHKQIVENYNLQIKKRNEFVKKLNSIMSKLHGNRTTASTD
ncbi:hypothetical protein BIY24_05455 [Halobacteriovorax marinus]|uniref:hypothetical protein n=1 Tax=Halobacteriovorax marinus TaxID=97084 RepID=UPI000BC2D755|nr:hypothetical protein [Halobacteriovorax marinus]ATH07404.1 hypothetical protein BIY24_05455 [Halobacteriovorax marinus]